MCGVCKLCLTPPDNAAVWPPTTKTTKIGCLTTSKSWCCHCCRRFEVKKTRFEFPLGGIVQSRLKNIQLVPMLFSSEKINLRNQENTSNILTKNIQNPDLSINFSVGCLIIGIYNFVLNMKTLIWNRLLYSNVCADIEISIRFW